MSDFSPESIRRRQWLLAGGLALLALGGVTLYFWAARPVPPPPADERMRKTLATTGRVDERAAWRAQAEADLNALSASQKSTAATASRLEQENKVLQSKLAAMERAVLTSPPPAPVPGYARETASPVGLPPAPPRSAVATRAEAMSTPMDQQSFAARGVQPGGSPASATARSNGLPETSAPAVPRTGIVTLVWPASPGAAGSAPARGAAASGEQTYLPSGTFVSAVLLTGLDAPTGGQANRNPHPVLLRLTDNAFLPSRMRSAVKDCFVVGAAYGDQSAERAYVRTETLSCVAPDGRVFDSKLSATVADGDDGSIGIRGKLVRRQGAFLQQALLASVASGIGQAFRSSSTTQSVSALGTTNTVQSGEEFKAGFAGGVSNAADRLANYFISEAEKLHAVVEVGAGRRVTVVFTGGLRLSLPTDATDWEDE